VSDGRSLPKNAPWQREDGEIGEKRTLLSNYGFSRVTSSRCPAWKRENR